MRALTALVMLMAGLVSAEPNRESAGRHIALPNPNLMRCASGRPQLWQDEVSETTALYPVQLVLDHLDDHGCPQGTTALYDKTVPLETIQAALDHHYGQWARADNADVPVKLWRVESEKFAIQLAVVGENGREEGRSKQSAIDEAGMKQVIYLSFALSEGNRGGFTDPANWRKVRAGPFSATGREARPAMDKILEHFPGYHVVTVAERNYDSREFIRRHFPKENPSIVQADFDGDGHLDYAILLRNDNTRTAKVVMLLCSEGAECRDAYDVEVSTNYIEVYLRPAPIGKRVSQTDAIDTNDHSGPVKLHPVGVEVNYYGKATVVYYWDKKAKKMKAIETED